MNIFIVGWKLKTEYFPKAVAELSSMIEIYPQLDLSTLWHYQSPSNALFMASMHSSNEAAAPRQYVYQDENEVVFYSGLPIDVVGNAAAHRAEDLATHWGEVAEKLEGQFVLIRADKVVETLELVTDIVGFERVFVHKNENMWVISNSVRLIEQIVKRSPLDPIGVSIFLTTGFVADNRTLKDDIRGVPGGQHWIWKKGENLSKSSYYSLSDLTRDAYVPPTPAFIDKLSNQMLNLCESVSHSFDQITCSLTGGRDSRLLAALLIHAGIDAKFYTSGPPTSDDMETATLITKTLKLPHTIESVDSEKVLDDWDKYCRRFLLQNDGMVSLWQVADVLRQKERIDHLDLFFWGAGGEIGRGPTSKPELFLGKETKESVSAYLMNRKLDSRGGLIREETLSLTKDYLKQFVDKYIQLGFAPFDLPDLDHLLVGNLGWFSNGARNSAMMADLITPFYSRSFLNAVYSLSPQQRYTEPLHYYMILYLVPELHRLPFGNKPWRPQHPIANLLYMYAKIKKDEIQDTVPAALRRTTNRIIPQHKSRQALEKISWLEIKLKQLREVCLDQSKSPLWDYIDRSVFERVTSSVTDPEVTFKQKYKLYTILTVFQYDAL